VAEPEGAKKPENTPLFKRLIWMAAIWLASVAVLSVVAYIIRLWLKAP